MYAAGLSCSCCPVRCKEMTWINSKSCSAWHLVKGIMAQTTAQADPYMAQGSLHSLPCKAAAMKHASLHCQAARQMAWTLLQVGHFGDDMGRHARLQCISGSFLSTSAFSDRRTACPSLHLTQADVC